MLMLKGVIGRSDIGSREFDLFSAIDSPWRMLVIIEFKIFIEFLNYFIKIVKSNY